MKTFPKVLVAVFLLFISKYFTVISANTDSPIIVISGVKVCTTITNIIWKIENFDFVQQNKTLIEQQNFEFTAGDNPECQSKLLIRLSTSSSETTFRPYLRLLTVFGDDSSVAVTVNAKAERLNGSYWDTMHTATLSQNQDMPFWTWASYNLTASNWLPFLDENKTLNIQIKLETTQNSNPLDTSIMQDFQKTSLNNLQANYGSLLSDSLSSDLIIICNDGTDVYAHSWVLKAQSPGFLSKIRSETQFSMEKNATIIISNIPGKTMEILLRYFYTGELPSSWMDADAVLEFMKAASKYNLKDIISMLDDMVGFFDASVKDISLLSIASKIGLKKAEFKLIKRIAKRVTESKTYADVMAIYAKNAKLSA